MKATLLLPSLLLAAAAVACADPAAGRTANGDESARTPSSPAFVEEQKALVEPTTTVDAGYRGGHGGDSCADQQGCPIDMDNRIGFLCGTCDSSRYFTGADETDNVNYSGSYSGLDGQTGRVPGWAQVEPIFRLRCATCHHAEGFLGMQESLHRCGSGGHPIFLDRRAFVYQDDDVLTAFGETEPRGATTSGAVWVTEHIAEQIKWDSMPKRTPSTGEYVTAITQQERCTLLAWSYAGAPKLAKTCVAGTVVPLPDPTIVEEWNPERNITP